MSIAKFFKIIRTYQSRTRSVIEIYANIRGSEAIRIYTIFIDMYCESILCVIDDEYMYLGVILLSYVMNIKNTKIKWIKVAYLEI